MPNPAQDSILIFRSVTGTDPADFAPIQTIADPYGPWSWTDPGPFVAGQTYIYTTERYVLATDSFSPMSPPVFATGPAPGGTETMNLTATGVQSKFGIGREITYGTPVLAQKMIDRKSGTIDIEFADPDHEALRNITTEVESVPGTAATQGTFKCTPSPEGISRIIGCLLGDPSTVNTPGPPSYNTHTWLDSFAQTPHTIAELKGPSFIVYPGCKADGMTLSIDKEQNLPIEFDFDMRALNKLLYILESSIGTDVAPFDPLPAYGPAQATCTMNTLVTDSAKTFGLNFRKQVKPRQVLNGYRGPVAHFATKTNLTGSIGQYFDSEAALRIYFGTLDAQAVPYGASRKIRTVPMVLTLASEVNAAGFVNQIILTIPHASFKKVGQQVNGVDEIMQATEFKAYHDPATGSCFKLQIVNSETLATITANGTNVATVPANGVNPLTF